MSSSNRSEQEDLEVASLDRQLQQVRVSSPPRDASRARAGAAVSASSPHSAALSSPATTGSGTPAAAAARLTTPVRAASATAYTTPAHRSTSSSSTLSLPSASATPLSSQGSPCTDSVENKQPDCSGSFAAPWDQLHRAWQGLTPKCSFSGRVCGTDIPTTVCRSHLLTSG